MQTPNTLLNRKSRWALATSLLLACSMTSASYIQVASWSDINVTGSLSIQNFVFTSPTELIVGLNGASGDGWAGVAVNRVTGIGSGNLVTTNIMGPSTWGANSFSPLRSSFNVNAGVLSFGVTGIASLAGFYDLNLTTGVVTNRATAESIQNTIPGNFTMSATATQVPNGDFFIYNSNAQNRSLVRLSGSTPSILLNESEIVGIFGTGGTIIQSMTALSNGSLILANGQNNVIAAFDPVTLNSSILLTTTELGSVTFQSFFAAPDGLVYFNTTNREIWSFDPANAVSTLTLVIDRDTIEAGPAGSASTINALGWYDGNIAWAPGGNNPPGIYAIPEPSTYGLIAALAVLGFVAWRRRRN
ncbi:MAG: PEP-CTERM sorting domain-containing protein [Verrucomicrobia bacterium]|nr:PEP-CTERM sorting domain-containing protein [Verrucomicrobiota bacterium]